MKAYSFYDQVAGGYNKPLNSKFYGHIADKLLDQLPPDFQFNNILEVGAGTGFTTQKLRKRFVDAHINALEPSFQMMSWAQKLDLDVDWLPLAFTDFESQTEYDLVISSMAAHWFSPYEWQKLLTLNQKSILALALPYLSSNIETEANSLLKHLLFKLKPDVIWPKHVRNFKLLLSNIQRNAEKVEVKDLSFTEEFANVEELADILFNRGVFLALFGSQAKVAQEAFAISHKPSAICQFSWSLKLIVSFPIT